MLWQVLSTGFRKVSDTHHNPFTHKTGWSSHRIHIKRWPLSLLWTKSTTISNQTLQESNFFHVSREKRSLLELFPALRKFVAHFTPPLLSDEHNKQKWALKWSELKKKHHSPPLQNSCAATCQLRSLTSTSHSGGVWPRTSRCHSFRTSCFAGWCYFQISTHTHKYTNRLFF